MGQMAFGSGAMMQLRELRSKCRHENSLRIQPDFMYMNTGSDAASHMQEMTCDKCRCRHFVKFRQIPTPLERSRRQCRKVTCVGSFSQLCRS